MDTSKRDGAGQFLGRLVIHEGPGQSRRTGEVLELTSTGLVCVLVDPAPAGDFEAVAEVGGLRIATILRCVKEAKVWRGGTQVRACRMLVVKPAPTVWSSATKAYVKVPIIRSGNWFPQRSR